MTKLVTLKFGQGSFEQGFPVMLKIKEDNGAIVEVNGTLPPNSDLLQQYLQWRSLYLGLGLVSRLSAPKAQVTNFSVVDCDRAAQQVKLQLNRWLETEPFRRIREKLLERLTFQEEVRVVLQIADTSLRQLPWSQWELIEQRFPKSEIALSTPIYEYAARPQKAAEKIKILAILGNAEGLDLHSDRDTLAQLPNAEVQFLVEPSRQALNDQFWEKSWDILFFAGHSLSRGDRTTGSISINATESLSIADLKYALQTSVQQGLKLAIFNSCDGLGLAHHLADLQIPQIIVMREPVPDCVAQSFLQYFLKAFSSGESLYLSVRHARERLQGLESLVPCASWLPVIYQNPAESPPTWQSLLGQSPLKTQFSPKRQLVKVLLSSLAIVATLTGIRGIEGLQSVEARVFDQMMQQRPTEGVDPRLLIVTIDDEDLKAQPLRQGSLSDAALIQLLEKLVPYHPRAIGLDLYRDAPISPQFKKRFEQLQKKVEFLAVCKASDPTTNTKSVAPPPEVPLQQIGFSDFLEDGDGVLRQQLLWMTPGIADPCQTSYAFSTQLAFRYLAADQVLPKFTSDQTLQLKDTVFTNQMWLNYRSNAQIAAQVPLKELLQGKVSGKIAQDRIVLIGVTAQGGTDYWNTPYGGTGARRMPGVFVQAHMVSQMISAVLEARPLIKTLPLGIEVLWLGGIALLGGLMAWRVRSRFRVLLMLSIIVVSLYIVCVALLIQGTWLPFVHLALSLIGTGSWVRIWLKPAIPVSAIREPH